MAANKKLSKVLAGRRVESVRQTEDTLKLDFEDGSTMEIQLKAATSSVAVRDKDNRLEYAD